MPRPPIDLGRKIKDILQHVGPLPPEADSPLSHYIRTATDLWNLQAYVVRHLSKEELKAAVRDRHLIRLREMVLVNLIQSFERFLKELAAVCVDHLAAFVLDRRFDEFQIRGSLLAAHFGSGTVGQSMCESDTWLDCGDINDRFRKLLADPFEVGSFYVFPQSGQKPEGERFRFATMNIVWQLRHTIVHNVGVVTRSDAVKFKLLSQEVVESPRVLLPTLDDVRHVRRFLDETAESVNTRVGDRLAELLTQMTVQHGIVFDAQEKADQLSRQFDRQLNVAGAVGHR